MLTPSRVAPMDISILLRIIGVGLIVAAAYHILNKSGREEQAILVSIAGVVLVLLMIVGEIADLIDTIRRLFGL